MDILLLNKKERYINKKKYIIKMENTICVNKEAIMDLVKLKSEFDLIVESLELMSDKAFMESYNKSKQQIKKREFVDWNEL